MQSVKAVIVGDVGVGKTCLILSYITNSFCDEYVPRVDFDNYSATVMVDGRPINCGCWDTSGSDDYDRLRPLSYPQTDVFVVAFSIVSKTSYENVTKKWIPELKHYAPHAPVILARTKLDLRDNPTAVAITVTEGETLKKLIGAYAYIECSSKTRNNVSEGYDVAIRAALENDNKKREGCF